MFPLVATYAPSASCGLPPIDGAGVELFTGYGSMSYCWRHFGFRIAALAENAASMQRTIRRGFPESVVIQDANAVNAAALQPASSSDSDADEDEPSSRTVVARCAAPAVKVASVYGGIPCPPNR